MKNLVLKGGGVRGIAYAGALQVLEDKGLLQGVQRVAGTSAGAITAALLAVGYTAAEIKAIVSGMDFNKWRDHWDPLRLGTTFGLYAGDYAFEWIEATISAKAGKEVTFSDLKKQGMRDLRVVSTSLFRQDVFIFSVDKTPDCTVAHAVRASMSIPLFFKAMQIPGINDLFVDGGTIWNYPLTIFDTDGPLSDTLGLYLTDFGQNAVVPVQAGHVTQYIKSLFETLLASQDLDIGEDPEMEKRSMRIDGLGIAATNFSITAQDQDRLYQSGVACAKKYLG